MQGKHTSNLKSHLATKHSDAYNEVVNLNKNINQQRAIQTKSDTSINTLKYLCMQLVAVHGRPFAMLNDEPFQKILNLAASSDSRSKEINIKAIKAMIPDVAYDIKLKIADEVRQKMISLKIDSATCLERRFLGINIQYINGNKIIVRNLAVLEIFSSQTAEYIKARLIEVLNDFMLHEEQIYSITTDNGSNMKRTTRLLGGQYYTEDEDMDLNKTDDAHNDTQDEDDDDEEEEEQDNEHTDDCVHDILNNFIDNENESFKIRGMLCAAHTLQLAIKDALNLSVEGQAILEMARKVVKILRKPLNRNLLKLANLNAPIIDCPTRWTSTYNMLVRLVTLKEFTNNINEVADLISTTFWSEVWQI